MTAPNGDDGTATSALADLLGLLELAKAAAIRLAYRIDAQPAHHDPEYEGPDE